MQDRGRPPRTLETAPAEQAGQGVAKTDAARTVGLDHEAKPCDFAHFRD